MHKTTIVNRGLAHRPSIHVNAPRLTAMANTRGWHNTTQLAQGLGVSTGNLSRVIHGRQRPGERFIAAVLAAFPRATFEEIFQVTLDIHEDALPSPGGTVPPTATPLKAA